MKYVLITTTIHVPHNLEAYAKDIREHGPDDTCIIVAGDKKTPPEAKELCEKIGAIYLSPEDQDVVLANIRATEYAEFLPWNCIQRRNVAILHAYHLGAEVIVTIDDDNLWEGKGYFDQHGPIGLPCTMEVTATNTGWYDILWEHGCYARGYSFKERGALPLITKRQTNGRIVVNGGLWTGDPDIDAVTRLALCPNIEHYYDTDLILDTGTKSPFNSQNTALHRDVIPAYCLAAGLGRYDDIVAGYIVKRIADHLGDYVSFGKPVVRQVRNQHNLYRDLADELLGMLLIDRIVDWLYEISLSGKTYKECIAELILEFEQITNKWFLAEEVPQDQILFLRSIIKNYRHWMAIT